jgi:hypothetical protein
VHNRRDLEEEKSMSTAVSENDKRINIENERNTKYVMQKEAITPKSRASHT